MVNLDIAARYLALLDRDSEFTFQTFPDADAGPWRLVLHGSLDQYAEQLETLNERGAGIFVMVNAGDGVVHGRSKTCRTAANVTRVRAVFVDLDGAPLEPVLTSGRLPDCIVQSSPNRWHAYFLVDDCSLDQFRSAQSTLAIRFNGDPGVKDLPRVMRIPGFVHRKAEPFLSRLYLPTEYDQIKDHDND